MGVANLATVRREVVDYVAWSLERLGVPGFGGRLGERSDDRDLVPARELFDLWERAVAESGDACLGVRVARAVSRRDFGLLSDVVLTRRSQLHLGLLAEPIEDGHDRGRYRATRAGGFVVQNDGSGCPVSAHECPRTLTP